MTPTRHPLAAWLAMPVAVAGLTVLARWGGANATTAGFLYLVLVLGLAAWGGWVVGATASVAATVCLNYFFVPPFDTFAVADPANWVSLLAFLAAAALTSRLVTNARLQAAEAQRRRREVEILYELCFGLFAASQRPGVLGEVAARTLGAIGAVSGVLLLLDAGEPAVVSAVGERPPAVDRGLLDRACGRREVLEGAVTYLPLHVGGILEGVLVAAGPLAPRTVLEPAGRLLALAIERERLLTEAAHLAAVHESDVLKTSLLRAVSHDLRTPLTSMRLEIESLEGRLADQPRELASVQGLAREQGRLARRIDNLLALARLEAGLARPRPEATPPAFLFRAAQESLQLVLAGREVAVRIERGCPDLQADPSLALEIVVNLLENAARAAPVDRPIELTAGPDGLEMVRLEVRDRGPGMPAGIKRLLQSPRDLRQEGSSGDTASGGLGLQIARSFTAACDGTLVFLDRSEGGTIARLHLPAAPDLEEPA